MGIMECGNNIVFTLLIFYQKNLPGFCFHGYWLLLFKTIKCEVIK